MKAFSDTPGRGRPTAPGAMVGRPDGEPAGARRRPTPARPPRAILLAVVGMLVTIALVIGWTLRDEYLLSPEEGTGYALGIVGLAAMVLLLPYSIRKRARFCREWGPLWQWFQVHMILGLVGPTLILFHANFRIGSLNSAVAVGCMLLVVASGVAGRVIYGRIHRGLSGRRLTLHDLMEDRGRSRRALDEALQAAPELARVLRDYESATLSASQGLAGVVAHLLLGGHRARRARRAAYHCLGRAARRPTSVGARGPRPIDFRPLRAAISSYVDAVRRVGEFQVLERVFSAWHVLHLPLTATLALTAVIHVVAVHMY